MRPMKWFGFWTLLGGVASVQLYFAHQRLGPDPWGWGQALEASLPVWYLWGLLSLVVVWLARRVPGGPPHLRPALFLYPRANPRVPPAAFRAPRRHPGPPTT